MTQTPEFDRSAVVAIGSKPDDGTPSMQAIAMEIRSQPTEMGFRVDIRSPAVNIMVEFDLDRDPVIFHSIIECLPQIVESQLEKWTKDKEE